MGTSQSSILTIAAKQRYVQRDTEHTAFSPPPVTAAAASLILKSASEQCDALASGAITSVELTCASIARSYEIGYSLNAITHELYTSALAQAKASDVRRAAGTSFSPLDGLPLSIKDVFDQEGCDNTLGLAARVGKPCNKDGLLIAIMRDAGLVFICRSNVPQCLMLPESDNNIFGRTVNPYNELRTPGGSSGGEGALIASRCTALGFGSDIGGSIRIPAAFCGCAGFKPTPERVTLHGLPAPRPIAGGSIDGQLAIRPVAGPLARNVTDLTLFCSVLMSPKQWLGIPGICDGDTTIPRQPWCQNTFQSVANTTGTKKLRFAIWGGVENDGFDDFFAPAPACTRAVRMAAAALVEAGHEVIAYSPQNDDDLDMRRAAVLFYALLGADGSLSSFKSGLEGEKLHSIYHTLDVLASLPNFIRPLLGAVLRNVMGWSRAADVLTNARSRSTLDWWELCREREVFKQRFITSIQSRGFDAILCPAMAIPAFLHGQSQDLNPACSPCFLFNLVGFPAVVLPCTTQGKDEGIYSAPPGQRGDIFFQEACRALKDAAGMPVGVQLAYLPFQDEKLLGAASVLERALNNQAGGGVPEEVLSTTLSRLREKNGG